MAIMALKKRLAEHIVARAHGGDGGGHDMTRLPDEPEEKQETETEEDEGLIAAAEEVLDVLGHMRPSVDASKADHAAHRAKAKVLADALCDFIKLADELEDKGEYEGPQE